MNGMPILKPKGMDPIPWDIIEPHEKQAEINHGQTLKRLAERGGLSPCEAVAILEDRVWRPMDLLESINRLAELIRICTKALDDGQAI